MADNIDITPGTGKTIATDEVGTEHFQRVKLTDGTANSSTVIAAGNGVAAQALRVTLASDSTGVVTVQDGGNVITVDGTVTVQGEVDVVGNVAHDAVDSGDPVKIGGKARSAFPAVVAADDRVNAMFDLFGRLLTAGIAPEQFVWKSFNATTAQTGADVWTPAAGKKIAVTSVLIGVYGTTAGRLILWFGDDADTTYTAGTDQLLAALSYAPSASLKERDFLVFPFPGHVCNTADRELHITTDAAMSVDLAVTGYEF